MADVKSTNDASMHEFTKKLLMAESHTGSKITMVFSAFSRSKVLL